MSLTDMNTSAGVTGLYTGKPAGAVTMTEQEPVWSQHWQMNIVHSLVGRRRHHSPVMSHTVPVLFSRLGGF